MKLFELIKYQKKDKNIPISNSHSQNIHAAEERVIKKRNNEPEDTAEAVMNQLAGEISAIYAKALDNLKLNSDGFQRKKLLDKIPHWTKDQFRFRIQALFSELGIRQDLIRRQSLEEWAAEELMIRLVEAGMYK